MLLPNIGLHTESLLQAKAFFHHCIASPAGLAFSGLGWRWLAGGGGASSDLGKNKMSPNNVAAFLASYVGLKLLHQAAKV